MLTVDYYYIPGSLLVFIAGILILIAVYVLAIKYAKEPSIAVCALAALMILHGFLPFSSFLFDREEPLVAHVGVIQEVDARNLATLESGERVALVGGARAGEQVDVWCLEAESICVQDRDNLKEMDKAFNAVLAEKADGKLSMNYGASMSEKRQDAE